MLFAQVARMQLIVTPPLKSSPRLLWLGVILTLAALLAALAGLYSVVYRDWVDEQRDSLVQELLWLEQSLRLHLEGHQQTVENMAPELQGGAAGQQRFVAAASLLRRESREIAEVQWVDGRGRVLLDGSGVSNGGQQLEGGSYDALWRAERLKRPVFGAPYRAADGKYRFDLAVPVLVHGRYQGGVRIVYDLAALLHHQVPWWIASQYHISVVDLEGKALASKFEQTPPQNTLFHQISFDPPGYGLSLRAVSYRAGVGLALPVLSSFIGLLTLALLYSLWRIRGHVRERAQAEKALQHEMILRQAIENSMKSGLLALDLRGQIVHVNRAFCELTGLDSTELVGQSPPYSFWPQDEAPLLQAAMQAVLNGELPEHGFELPFCHRDGERFEVRFYATPLRGNDGRHTGWVASLYDITELKKKRLALNYSHQRFLSVLNGLDVGLCVTDGASSQLLYANPAFAEMWAQFEPAGLYCPMLPGLAGAAPADRVSLEFSPDHDEHWFQLQYRKISWVNEEEAWLAMLVDVTEQRQRDERARTQDERFQTTSRLIAMGEMASSLAHELNQPLTAISTYAAGVSRRLPEAVQQQHGVQEAIQAIVQQARRAGQIVNSIRAFVKKHAPQLENADPDLAVSRAHALALPLAEKYGAQLLWEPGGKPVTVQMDPVLIEQVLLNLIKNAVEAMREADVRRPLVAIRTEAGERFWRVEVSDSGPGLAQEVKDNLFTPFYSTKPDGMGIGLNICRSIVEFHHGEFGVSDTLAGGCVFWFTLPLSGHNGAQ